jgi:hypothetical protein
MATGREQCTAATEVWARQVIIAQNEAAITASYEIIS